MNKLSISNEINTLADAKFPTYEVDFDFDGSPIDKIVFRNLIALSPEERKRYARAAVDVQDSIAQTLRDLDDAPEGEREQRLNDALDLDITSLQTAALRVQLLCLAGDTPEHEAALAALPDGTVAALFEAITEGGVVSGESQNSPNS